MGCLVSCTGWCAEEHCLVWDLDSGMSFPGFFMKYCWIKGSADRKQASAHSWVPGNYVRGKQPWQGERRIQDGMFSCQNPQCGEEALTKPPPTSCQCWVYRERTSRNVHQLSATARITEGLDLTNNHDKGFGQVVLGCICSMKWCHHKGPSDNSLGVTNLLA